MAESRLVFSKEEIELNYSNEEEILSIASREFWISECASLIQEVLGGLPPRLEKNTFLKIESILESNSEIDDKVLNHLLIAPLSDEINISDKSHNAIILNLFSTASILDKLRELQPLLLRMVENWLSITIKDHYNLLDKSVVWKKLVFEMDFEKILTASSKVKYERLLNSLLFEFPNARQRILVKKYLDRLIELRFPDYKVQDLRVEDLVESEKKSVEQDAVNVYETIKSVERQINTIISLVGQGKDDNAKKYLNELVEMQTSYPDGIEYALKSLCNIAKKSADLMREDFEAFALRKAFELPKVDQWTFIQYSDHLKRLGKYDEALDYLEKARELGEVTILESLRADIYANLGEYEQALEIYEEINDDDFVIDNSKADIYRKINKFDEAEKIYQVIQNDLEGRAFSSNDIDTLTRAYVGLAEVKKLKGDLIRAKYYYEEALKFEFKNPSSYIAYSFGYCQVLKLNEEFEEAYRIVDSIIQKYPFVEQAQYVRASILGLIRNEIEGLENLSQLSSEKSTWDNWLKNYLSGVLLLKLDRFSESKDKLIDISPEDLNSSDKDNTLRLGAALWYIANDEFDEASNYLQFVNTSKNRMIEYLG
ncbi:MAG: tetratricopeptide repeat protein, partial [Balneola sp.]